MREIKFRGKRTDNGEWVYGSAMLWNGFAQIISHLFMLNNIWQIKRVRVVPESVGEFTGLKDKNGKEIYEGDVVNFVFDGVIFVSNPYYVVFEAGAFLINKPNFHPLVSDCENVEIIGNIYENPSLLSSTKS